MPLYPSFHEEGDEASYAGSKTSQRGEQEDNEDVVGGKVHACTCRAGMTPAVKKGLYYFAGAVGTIIFVARMAPGGRGALPPASGGPVPS